MIETQIKSTSKDKKIYVNELFGKIARKYDLLNNLMTFGNHLRWKEYAIKSALKEINSPNEALDLCSGTADLAIILNKYCPNTKITCIDNCREMLSIASTRINKLNTKNTNTKKITLDLMDIENIAGQNQPSSFDLITIGFGLRNITNKEKCIQDSFKLLRKNGVFVCIDLGHPINPIWSKIYSFYFFNLIPRLGEIFARDKEAYLYLTKSLLTWYKQEELKDLFIKYGFRKSYYKNILGGAVAIHIGIK